MGDTYELRWYAQVPRDSWGSAYTAPVAEGAGTTGYWFYNDTDAAITIDHAGADVAIGSFVVPANSSLFRELGSDIGLIGDYSGVRFTSAGGEAFSAFAQIDADGGGQIYDWGYPLVPDALLTSQVLVGFGWGNTNNDPGVGSRSVVWTTPVADAYIFVDYNGDGTFDANSGLTTALGSTRFIDPNDQDMSGARIVATTGINAGQPEGTRVNIAAAWGQDPSLSFSGDGNALDLGTVILPLPEVDINKRVLSITDPDSATPDTLRLVVDETDDLITYEIVISNDGGQDLTNGVLDESLLGSCDGRGVCTPAADATLSGPAESITADLIFQQGETWTYTGTYQVPETTLDDATQSQPFRIPNTAEFTTDQTPTIEDSENVPVIPKTSIRIIKVATPESSQAFAFNGVRTVDDVVGPDLLAAAGEITLVDDGVDNGSDDSGAIEVLPGTYQITESPLPAGWTLTGVSGDCTLVQGAQTAEVVVAAGVPTTCVFTNTAPSAQVRVAKTWENAIVGDAVTITSSGGSNNPSVNSTATDVDTTETGEFVKVYAGETLTFGERFTAGADAANYSTTLDCGDGPIALDDDLQGSFTVPDSVTEGDEITCTFTNTRKSAVLLLAKAWEGATAGDTVELLIEGDTGPVEVEAPASTPTATITAFAGADYDLAEVIGANDATYEPTSLVCDGTNAPTGFVADSTGASGNIVIAAQDANTTVSCTFTNAARPTLVVDKTTEGGTGTFTFDVTPDPDDGAEAATPATLTVTTTTDEVAVRSDEAVLVTGEGYTVTEQDPGGDWSAGDVVCSVTNAGQVSNYVPNTPTRPGDAITCDVTNFRRGAVSVLKTIVDDVELVDASTSTYRVTYNLQVTSASTVPEDFSLEDVFTFGGNTEITGYEATRVDAVGPPPSPVWDGGLDADTPQVVLASGEIAANGELNYTVAVTFTVAPTITSAERDCTPAAGELGTGTLNTATVAYGNQRSLPSPACSPIPGPVLTVDKTPDGTGFATQVGGTTSWEAVYAVSVTNTGQGPASYSLSDVPVPVGDAVTKIEIDGDNINQTVDSTPFTFTSAPIAIDPAPVGDTETHTYEVTVTFTVDPTTPAADRTCDADPTAGQGSYNVVSIAYNDGGTDIDTACVNIPEPVLGVSKDFVSATDADLDGVYDVQYTVTVTNTSPWASTYDLADTPSFDSDLEIVSGAASTDVAGNQVISPYPAGPWTLATGQPIDAAGGTDDTHVYTLTFLVDANNLIEPTGDPLPALDPCTGVDGQPGEALFNSTTLTNAGRSSSSQACGEAPLPGLEIDKTVATALGPDADGFFTIAYDIVVENLGDAATEYNLADTPGFDTDLPIDGIPTAAATDGTNPIVVGDYSAPTWDLVTTQPIAAGATHTYTLTFVLDGSAIIASPGLLDPCAPVGPSPGEAFYNEATVTYLGNSLDGEACVTAGIPTIEVTKNVIDDPAQPVLVDGATYTVSYEIAVNNIGTVDGAYTLSDVPAFHTDATVTNIAVGGDAAIAPYISGDPIVTDQELPAGESDTYVVVVTFTIDPAMSSVDRACSVDGGVPGEATYNLASITYNGGGTDEANDCVPIPESTPEVSVDKSISSGPTDNFDGTFTIVYSVDVTNTATGGTGQYDLSDVATFSPGVTIDSQAVVNTVPGTIVTDATFPTSGTIVTGQTILPGATHTYEVTVVATLAVDSTTTYVECSSTTGAAGEGLYNEAELTVNGEITTDDVCEDIAGDLMIEKSDDGVELVVGDFVEYQLKVTNVGGVSTGSPVIVTDVLPVEFQWVDFPDTAGSLPFCNQSDQTLTCEIDATLVDAGGESTSFLVTAEVREGTAESIDGYENLSYVDSPDDPAPSTPVCEPTAISSASSEALSAGFATPTNNVACDRTPVLPTAVIPIEPPTTTPPTTVPPTAPTPTVPPEGLPRTGSDGSMNTLGLAALLLGLGVGLTLIVRRRQQQP